MDLRAVTTGSSRRAGNISIPSSEEIEPDVTCILHYVAHIEYGQYRSEAVD